MWFSNNKAYIMKKKNNITPANRFWGQIWRKNCLSLLFGFCSRAKTQNVIRYPVIIAKKTCLLFKKLGK